MLYFFIAAHFLGDYVLQTDRLFYYKKNYKWGTFLHATIVGIIPFFIFFPFLRYKYVIIGLFLNWLSHIIIDYVKNALSYKNRYIRSFIYLTDQFLHIFTIFIIYNYFMKQYDILIGFYTQYAFYAIFIAFLIWVSYGIFYLLFFLSNFDRMGRLHLKYKIMDMMERIVLFIMMVHFLSTWFVLVPFVIYRFYIRRKEKLWFIYSLLITIISSIVYSIVI